MSSNSLFNPVFIQTFYCQFFFIQPIQTNPPSMFATTPTDDSMDTSLNFLRDLIRVLLPDFYLYNLSQDYDLDLLFCHRWLVLCFKREFLTHEVLKIWEACWARWVLYSCINYPCCNKISQTGHVYKPLWQLFYDRTLRFLYKFTNYKLATTTNRTRFHSSKSWVALALAADSGCRSPFDNHLHITHLPGTRRTTSTSSSVAQSSPCTVKYASKRR